MSICKRCVVSTDWEIRAAHCTRCGVYKLQPSFRGLICLLCVLNSVNTLQTTTEPEIRKTANMSEETGFITLFTLCLSLLCFLLIGSITYELRQYLMHSWRYEQTARADLLAQDAIELAKLQLSQNVAWRGLSNWISRPNGSCQFKIKTNSELPISPTVQTQYPNGLFIQATGKTADGSTRVIDVWYIPSTQKTKAIEYV